MKSQSLAVIELPATASSSLEGATHDMEKKLMRPNNEKLEAFSVRLAWAFASAILLLLLVSLLLLVAGYAGSTFASNVQSKTVSSSRGGSIAVHAKSTFHSCTWGYPHARNSRSCQSSG
jgi:hypothetical protein